MPVSAMKTRFQMSAARFINKEGQDDFRNSFTRFIRDRYNLSYNVSNWIHETNDDIKPLDMHAKPF